MREFFAVDLWFISVLDKKMLCNCCDLYMVLVKNY